MKIGIITLPPSFNYGNILQAWALQTILERMGHQAEIVVGVPRRFKLSAWSKPLVYAKRAFQKYIGGEKNIVVRNEEIMDVLLKNTECFIQSYLHLREFKSFADIKETDYNAFVVGSDQIWRKRYNADIRNCYLKFAKDWNVRRVAYAASFGTANWEYSDEETKECSDLLSLFDGISVRERSGVALVKNKLQQEALHVLDPTLLLDKEDYESLFLSNKEVPQSKGDLLCYVLSKDESVSSEISRIAREKALVPFRVNSRFDEPTAPLEERIQPPVESWLRGFYDAKLVATDSFHATVFSIIFKKPFIIFGSGIRGNERMESLLTMAGFNLDNGFIGRLFEPSDSNVECIRKYREKSLEFLKTSVCKRM